MANQNHRPFSQNNRFPAVVRQSISNSFLKLQNYSRMPVARIAALGLLAYILVQKDFSFSISFGRQAQTNSPMATTLVDLPRAQTVSYHEEPAAPVAQPEKKPAAPKSTPSVAQPSVSKTKFTNQAPRHWWEEARQHSQNLPKSPKKTAAEPVSADLDPLNLANPATAVSEALTEAQKKKAASFSNLGFILNPNFAAEHNIDAAIVQAKNKVCFDYIAKFAPVAQEEARLYNIPASITIAQGLLESNAGGSNLAKKDHNHFGIKCRAQCIGCRCANYTDDSRFDMFRIFESDAQSFREHSLLLTGARYKHLLQLPRSDYKNWAYGLKAAGYATDAKYAQKLITIIEVLQLHKLDEQ